MKKTYDLYVGDRQGRSHLPTSFVYDNWECIFSGTKKECNDFVQANNIKDHVLIVHGKKANKGYLQYQSAIIQSFQRVCDHYIPVSRNEYGKTIYQYKVTFSTGKSSVIKSTNSDLQLSEGEKVKFIKTNKHIILV